VLSPHPTEKLDSCPSCVCGCQFRTVRLCIKPRWDVQLSLLLLLLLLLRLLLRLPLPCPRERARPWVCPWVRPWARACVPASPLTSLSRLRVATDVAARQVPRAQDSAGMFFRHPLHDISCLHCTVRCKIRRPIAPPPRPHHRKVHVLLLAGSLRRVFGTYRASLDRACRARSSEVRHVPKTRRTEPAQSKHFSFVEWAGPPRPGWRTTSGVISVPSGVRSSVGRGVSGGDDSQVIR
jgi:hypothetical protein